jgi:hypothetical protein
MPENENVIGDYWTKESVALMKKLGWKQVGCSNFDITCSNHKAERKGKKHGVDSIFQYYDPFLEQQIYVNVESKTRAWKGIDEKAIREWIVQVTGVMECASQAPELHALKVNNIKNSLVLCWCNDGNYNHEKYTEYLKKISFKSKNTEYNIFLAFNKDILRWCSLIDTIDKLKVECNKFNVFYPTIIGESTTNLLKAEYVTLFFLYSKYIFATAEVAEQNARGVSYKKQNIVFNFDEISLQSLLVMYDAFKQYQLQDADEYVIYLYDKKSNVRTYIEEFKNTIENQQKAINEKQQIDIKPPSIVFKYLSKLDGLKDIPYSILGLSEEE